MSENKFSEIDEAMDSVGESAMDFSEFIDQINDNPTSAMRGVDYLIEAIEHYGTRDTFEKGEEKERYRFFDDPFGDGEHAVLGNTEALNDFVDELRRISEQEGETEKIVWFQGPTATGKSEMKRCIINGLKGFSKTEEGKRYTVEWTLDSLNSSDRSLSYGDAPAGKKDWYRSPVNTNPLSVVPEEVREKVVDNPEEVDTETELDPFSNEAYQRLQSEFSDSDQPFSDIVSEGNLQVVRYTVDKGDGVGVLHSEDIGDVKQRLVGSWMQGAMEEFASRGRKNPQAFSYDGVLSQGNAGVSIIEDAVHHFDALQKLLNVVEEKEVKLDNKISMDIDTLLLVISNPDLEANLVQHRDQNRQDPLRALRRRMKKFEMKYLTNPVLETQLIRRLLNGETDVWDCEPEDNFEKISEPIEVYGTEFSPHAIEAAAMYDIITRMMGGIPEAIVLAKGYFEDNGDRVEAEDIDFDTFNGESGMPVTFTIDALSELAQEEDVVTADTVIDGMVFRMEDSSVFSQNEIERYRNQSLNMRDYIHHSEQSDVLKSMIGDTIPTEEEIRDYVDDIYHWEEGNHDEYDVFEVREFEIKNFGFTIDDYKEDEDGNTVIPKGAVQTHRKDDIINPINQYIWDNGGSEEWEDLPLKECPKIQSLLGELTWSDVYREYNDFDPTLWRDPPSNSETEELKEKTIDNMVDQMDYTEESAEIVAAKVIDRHNSNEVVADGS